MDKNGIDGVYIVSKEAGAGSMVLAAGLMEMLKAQYGKVAVYKPIVDNESDTDIAALTDYFSLDQHPEMSRGLMLDDAERVLSEQGLEALLEKILERYRMLGDSCDFVLSIGSDLEGLNSILGFDLNIVLAKNFSVPIAGIFSMKDREGEDLGEIASLWSRSISKEGVDILMLCANHCPAVCEWTGEVIKEGHIGSVPVYCIPRCDELERLSIADIMEHLPVEWLMGNETHKERSISSFRLGTMDIGELVENSSGHEFIITSSSRIDLLFGVVLSAQSVNRPPGSGILLCGKRLADNVVKILEGLGELPVPVLHTSLSERELILDAIAMKASIRPGNRKKMDRALTLFAESVDRSYLKSRLGGMKHNLLTPTMFRLGLYDQARECGVSIVLPESEDERILKAADIILRKKIASLVLLGRKEDIYRRSRSIGVDLSSARIVDHRERSLIEKYARIYYETRRHKGITPEKAIEAVMDKNLFATIMVKEGMADGMVSGAAHSTRDTILPALRVIKTQERYSMVSSCFFMCLPDRVLVYADCAVNSDPDYKELATIAIQSAESAARFGIEPRVAMLSYSTGSSGVGEDVKKVREATELLKEMVPDLPVEGPIQYDAAIDTEVAKIKMPDSPVAGRATVLIFPDLDTGNIAYKAVQRSAGAIAIGPVMQGLSRPVNDLSRGCSVEDIVDTVALTAIQAREYVSC